MATKPAKDLQPTDIILPPKRERRWLKSNLTVIRTESVEGLRRMAKGPWILVTVSFVSPYSDPEELSKSVFHFRPDTKVRTSLGEDSNDP